MQKHKVNNKQFEKSIPLINNHLDKKNNQSLKNHLKVKNLNKMYKWMYLANK